MFSNILTAYKTKPNRRNTYFDVGVVGGWSIIAKSTQNRH